MSAETKTCIRCEKEYPATTDHFDRYGSKLKRVCKACTGGSASESKPRAARTPAKVEAGDGLEAYNLAVCMVQNPEGLSEQLVSKAWCIIHAHPEHLREVEAA